MYRLAVNLFLISVIFIQLAGCSNPARAPVRSLSGERLTQQQEQTQETIKPQRTNTSSYKVRAGDTLYSIAFRYGLNYQGLASKNKIKSPYRIYIGQEIILDDSVPVYQEVIRPQSKPAKKENDKKQTANTGAQTTNKPPKQTTVPKQQPVNTKVRQFDSNRRVQKWLWPIARHKAYTKRDGQQLYFKVKQGTKVQAVASGRVVYSGNGLVGYGHLVIIKHNQNLLSAYAFNDEIFVKEKQEVKAGQTIATVGKSPTGDVGLGFEIRSKGKPINPLRYLNR